MNTPQTRRAHPTASHAHIPSKCSMIKACVFRITQSSRIERPPSPPSQPVHQRFTLSSLAALAASRFCLNCLYRLRISPVSTIPSTTLLANFSRFLRDQFSRSSTLAGVVCPLTASHCRTVALSWKRLVRDQKKVRQPDMQGDEGGLCC